MSKSLKILLFAAGGLVGLLVLVAVALLLFVDLKAYQPRLEAAVSEALGLEVQVGGKLALGLFPGPHVTLGDVHLRNRGAEIASAKEASFGIDLLPLLRQQVRIGKIALKRPTISIERDRDGKFNFEKPEEAGRILPAFDLAKFSLSEGTLSYVDEQSGEGFEAWGCKLAGRRLRLASGKSPDFLKRLSLTAEIACREIRTKVFTVSDLRLSVARKNGAFDLKPVTMRVFGGQGQGSIRADFSGAVPLYHVNYSLSKFRIEELFKTLTPNKVAEGPMDFSANLSLRGKTLNEMKQGAEGEVSLRGENLTLEGTDLDEEFARYESSQRFNLVDAGAFFFAGPFGLAVTKGYSFANVLRGSGGHSIIPMLVSDWKLEHGVAQAQDVAMATKQNRVALKGRLDFAGERFDDVTMALIDDQGCIKVQQKIHGTFQKPVVEKPNVFKSLAGPALRLLKKGRELLPGGQCEVFYAGSVPPPNKL